MSELITWLDAQLAYDEADVVNARTHRELPAAIVDRLKREVDAKRQRLAVIEHDLADDPDDETAQRLLRLELLPYADRPGYRPEWTPDRS